MATNTEKIMISLSSYQVDLMTKLVRSGEFTSKSELIRAALREFLKGKV